MSRLRLALLGTPEVLHGERVLTFSTRKVLALLIYLAVEKGMHSREKLSALLWPESEAREGGATLRSTIARLRTSLDNAPDHPHLIVERDALGFHFTSDVDLDLAMLEAAFKRSQVSTKEDLHGDARRSLLAELQRAVECYRGGFLDGFYISDAPDFEDWTRLQREIWHRRMSLVFDRLSQVQFSGGEFPSAIDTTTRWLTHEPLNERAYQRLMELYFTIGDRNAALQAYESCRARLAKELHTRPAPETEALAERIRSKAPLRLPSSFGLRAETLPPGRPQGSPLYPAPLPPLHFDIPLVGRAREYSTLIEAYSAAERGQVQIVLLKGEAGIGKTRLATEFLGWAAAQGADVLSGRAFETGSRLPYQPLVESLRSRIERENAPDDLLSDTWLAELSRVLPELRDRYPDLPLPHADETTARIRLFEAVARLMQALAERAPVVLFIDDVHRADTASLDLLHYAGRRWMESGTPLLLLLCLRSEALSTTKTLYNWLAEFESSLHATSLAVDALTLEDALQLIQALDAGSPTKLIVPGQGSMTREPAQVQLAGFGRWLFAETQGQPFYMIETLRALRERGLLILRLLDEKRQWAIDFDETFRHEGWTMHTARGLFAPASSLLPQGVREVIRARLAQLTPVAFALLTAGAVLGHDFSFEHLCQVAALGENDALPALDEVLINRLLAEGNATGRTFNGTYGFTHDKIRNVVYTEAGEARRRVFHRRALEVLQGTVAPAAELSYHALAAGLTERAFHLSVAAGDDAMKLFAVRDAIPHYEQARSLLAEQQGQGMLPENFSLPTIQHLYIQLGRAYELINDTQQARRVYEEMLVSARKSSSSTMEQTALNHLAALTAQNPFELKQAATLLDQTLQVAGSKGDSGETMPTAEEAETEWNLAQLDVYRFELASALEHGERALTIARQLGHKELIARSLNVLGYALMTGGCWEEGEHSLEEAALLFRALGDWAMEVDSLTQAASSKINYGRPHAAVNEARAAHTISIEIENTWGQVNSGVVLAQGLLEIGAFTEALSIVQEVVANAQTHNLYMLLYMGNILLGEVHRAMLDPNAARAAHLEMMGVIESMGTPPLIEALAAKLCADCILAQASGEGKWEEAHTYALQALTNRTDFFIPSTKLTLWYETEALVHAGEIERATEDVQHYGELIGKNRRYRISYLRALAVLAQYRGEIEQAIEHLQEAAQLAEEIGLPGELWPILAALGELYLRQGNEEQSRAAFIRAAEVVQSLANSMEDEQLRRMFLSTERARRVLTSAG